MRLLTLLVVLAVPAFGQPADAPYRNRFTPGLLHLQAVQAQREDVGIAVPVTLASVGMGLLLTGVLFDAGTANARPGGGPSNLGMTLYTGAAVLVPPAICVLIARLVQRGMLSEQIRDLERLVAAGW